MTMPSFSSLQAKLDQLAAKGTVHLKTLARREALEKAWQVLQLAVPVAPVLIILTVLIAKLSGSESPLSYLQMVLLFVLVPVVAWGVAFAVTLLGHKIDRRVALAFYDQRLGVKDRLQTADEFINKEQLSDFEQAAVSDAVPFIDEALSSKLPAVNLAGPKLSHHNWKYAALGVGVLAVAMLLNQAHFSLSGTDDASLTEPVIAAIDTRSNHQSDDPMAVEENAPRQPETQAPPQAKRQHKAGKPSEGSQPVEPQKASPGTPKAASAASDQESSSKQSQSGSAGSGASSQSSGSKDEKKKDEKPAGTQKKKSEAKPKEAEEQEQNSAAGVASGKGNTSGQNPADSDKEAADNKAQQEDEGTNDEDPESEEDEEQKANSAASPKKNQRKAPVDRKLSPSGAMGDKENEDANGRGGPGGLKKTRGVAAMLLGVPMPDRLQGTPNPGRTKSIQEQSQPEEQVVAPVAASFRGTSNGPIGQLAHKDLMPQLKQVVRDYFTALRTKEASQSATSTTTSQTTNNTQPTQDSE
ncbi:hypothetical protein QP938_03855 [Porticoccaceae bacterium LTM1]|nr:hypothetical protein QP938_03855 [Porticoccaceae bacterium LTM1]